MKEKILRNRLLKNLFLKISIESFANHPLVFLDLLGIFHIVYQHP